MHLLLMVVVVLLDRRHIGKNDLGIGFTRYTELLHLRCDALDFLVVIAERGVQRKEHVVHHSATITSICRYNTMVIVVVVVVMIGWQHIGDGG